MAFDGSSSLCINSLGSDNHQQLPPPADRGIRENCPRDSSSLSDSFVSNSCSLSEATEEEFIVSKKRPGEKKEILSTASASLSSIVPSMVAFASFTLVLAAAIFIIL